MDEATSHRLKLLRFPLIVLVLYIHSYIAPLKFNGSAVLVSPAPWLVVIETAWSNGFARTAVPLFFIMSGYLYFFKFDGSKKAYYTKTASRIRTLLVPWLLWNSVVVLAFAVGQSIPWSAGYFNSDNGLIADATVLQLVDMVLGVTHYPMAYQFWFVRDLFVIALTTPILHFCLKNGGPALPLALFAWWCAGWRFVPIPSIDALTFFVIGAWIGIRGETLFPSPTLLTRLLPAYLVLLAGDVYLRIFTEHSWLYPTALVVGIFLVLAVTGLIEAETRLSKVLVALAPASFFVFAAHEPLMTVPRKLLYHALPPTQLTMLSIYMLLPLGIIIVLTGLYFTMRHMLPRFTAVISGAW